MADRPEAGPHEPVDPGGGLGVHPQQQGNICQRPEGYENDARASGRCKGGAEELDRMHIGRVASRCRQAQIGQPVRAVDAPTAGDGLQQRLPTAATDRDVWSARRVEDR